MLSNPRYHIYLLQLENFHLTRFMASARRDLMRPPQSLRHSIKWTPKLSAVVSLATLMSLIIAGLLGWGSALLFSSVVVGVVVGVILLAVLAGGFFIPLSLATLALRPFDRLLRRIIIRRAKRKVSQLSELTIIAITGSYGKTTMKQTLATLLSGSREVVFTPDSFNTPVSIARFILSDVDSDTDVFIVEMGAYQVGDIKELCQIAPPDISILTGINEAHLERFGSLENTIQAKFEIATAARPSTAVICNADDAVVLENYQRFLGERPVMFYSAKNADKASYQITDKRFHADGSGISFRVVRGDQSLGYVKVSHLGDYIVGNIMAALDAAEVLGIDPAVVLKNAHHITPAEHRLQPIQRTQGRVLVIDDSYNGNPAGAHAAIDVLEQFFDRRTLYVTPGLVEMGKRSEAVHKEIGEHLAEIVDVVVLVETSVTGWIKAGLETAEFSGELVTFSSPTEMHAGINDLLKPGDVLLFQNDWPENYR
jgi:UDP-N-acetylmuramoyl-tripeptide--D-alanyl-D-alanine ligase